jgi:hypothetical protein
MGSPDLHGASSTIISSLSLDRCGLLDLFGDFPSGTNNVRPTQGGVAAHRRHGLEVEDEGHLKDIVVIFVFIGVLCSPRCFLLMP